MKNLIIILIMALAPICIKAQIFSNSYHDNPNIESLSIERATVYDPTSVSWSYSHHASIAFFDGKFYAIYSNGISGEDDPGQRVMISSSSDFINWSTPQILKTPILGENGLYHVITPGGITVADGKLVVYYTNNERNIEYEDENPPVRIDPQLYAITSSDGINWSEPSKLGLRAFPSHRPLDVASGRLVMTTNASFFYTDAPSGTTEWKSAGSSRVNRCLAEDKKPSLVEGAFLQHNNGHIYTLFRAGATEYGYLWQTVSTNNGLTWSSAIKTRFTDNNTKSHFGNLPDGRYYYIGTPDTTKRGARHPLIFAVSSDGFSFDKTYTIANDKHTRKYNGKWKAGDFGYPYSIVHDGYIYVIVSRHKEKIEVIRFSLNQLTN